MKFILKKDNVQIEDAQVINSGTINFYNLDVIKDAEWSELYTELVIFQDNEKSTNRAVVNGKVSIDQALNGDYNLGFVGYILEGDTKIKQISTNLIKIRVEKGAGEVEVLDYNPSAQDLLLYDATIKARLNELNGEDVGDNAEANIDYAIESKNMIKESIRNKGGEVSEEATLREYAARIDELKLKPILQDKEVTPTTEVQEIVPDLGIDGLGKVTVDAIQTEEVSVKSTLEDKTIKSSEGKFISEVFIEKINLEEKEIMPQIYEQNIEPSNLFDGIRKMKIGAVTSEIDSNITPNNIRKGVTILNVEGNVEVDKPDQEKTVTPTTELQEVFADAGYELGKVTVNPILTEEKTIKSTTEDQEILPEEGKFISKINVKKVEYQEKEVNPSIEVQEILPDLDKDALSKVVVNPVTSDIDENIKPENIVSGATILGVEGNVIVEDLQEQLAEQKQIITDLEKAVAIKSGKAFVVPDGMKFGCSRMLPDFNKMDFSNIKDMSKMFYDSYLKEISYINTAKTISMNLMFSGCSDLTNLDLSGFYTSNVTDMSGMFSYCSKLTDLNLSNFNMIKVTSMSNMFGSCSKLTEDTLKSILKMLKTATKLSASNKTLKYIGLNSTQATTCTTFPEWQDLVNMGWTTGY